MGQNVSPKSSPGEANSLRIGPSGRGSGRSLVPSGSPSEVRLCQPPLEIVRSETFSGPITTFDTST